MSVVLTILAWIGWVLFACVGLFLAMMFLAFGGDAPRANKALQKAIPLSMAIVFGSLLAGVLLMMAGAWWQVVLAYVLALSPPVAIGTVTSIILKRTQTPAGSSEAPAGDPEAPTVPPEK